MKIIIDIDGVLCEEGEDWQTPPYRERCPLPGAVAAVKDLFKRGHHIIIFTARHWEDYADTWNWLQRHGIPYDTLIMGKPLGDVYIDDKAIRFSSWGQIKESLDESANHES